VSFIYPRRITISRPIATSGVGALSYQGLLPSQETVLFTNIPASIQRAGGTGQKTGLPGDAFNEGVWKIIIPAYALVLGSFTERDIITDDLSKRYQVATAYWNSLGYSATCELLQT
jgi:hypothetical protein